MLKKPIIERNHFTVTIEVALSSNTLVNKEFDCLIQKHDISKAWVTYLVLKMIIVFGELSNLILHFPKNKIITKLVEKWLQTHDDLVQLSSTSQPSPQKGNTVTSK
jgi:hypothetical protein